MEKVKLTKEGYELLKKELDELKRQLMFEIPERIKAARELGDLSENSEYQEAKNEQGRIASRINELEQMLMNAEIITEASNSSTVNLGDWVILKNLDTGEEMKIQLVNPQEADIFANKISIESPLGRGVNGAKKGQTVKIKAPKGIVKYQVIEINSR
ncbi:MULTISPECIES: transcription elongation factor GreA [Fervidobacterium]|uniref:Transcription elongation factor GreA n=1 Tax=Fervidobacterium nodosum (strain ATCC 35602 / DSM 5306 / Rt17-B1) TaxID=381764 RepID=A7HM69_FERNB|nr:MULTISPECIES: transcription elongation factor GreA [Fervidobacterium]ABS61002.1 transcription elongation factor GreA [Fervidobacterium nodosum Rt17-B1]KAF2962328.1 transcription elongation factor GreA [Fervidobacterium sp. 2310opik-2]PHJ14244.1 transcription elongation factor GreA [Fervidobacterium sp. SC_NGM5_G05]HOJ93995.1 transcription elongation factor GreA [Fervidobacterium nodosum]